LRGGGGDTSVDAGYGHQVEDRRLRRGKKYGATKIAEAPGKPQGYEETGSVSSAITGMGFSAASSNAPNHTYEMEADALTDVGHAGFQVDAQAIASK
jgi:hypothetical protein